jgi:hypothetical protein
LEELAWNLAIKLNQKRLSLGHMNMMDTKETKPMKGLLQVICFGKSYILVVVLLEVAFYFEDFSFHPHVSFSNLF